MVTLFYKLMPILVLISCQKKIEPTISGKWFAEEAVYDFSDELIISEDGVSENYCYYIYGDTIYLDYGLPFVIEKLSESELILSKDDGFIKYWYEFYR